jgi:hypothetical protein
MIVRRLLGLEQALFTGGARYRPATSRIFSISSGSGEILKSSVSVMVRGTPGRGSSPSPSRRQARNRARHLVTVPRLRPSRAATARLLPPSAQARTIRARSARPAASPSSPASAARHETAPAAPACYQPYRQQNARRGPTEPQFPDQESPRRRTPHVVPLQLKTGTLASGVRGFCRGHLICRRWSRR